MTAVEGGFDGYLELWAAGMPPTQVAAIAAALPRHVLPLSPAFFRRVHVDGVDLDWLRAMVDVYPPEFAEWAVQHEGRHFRIGSHSVTIRTRRDYDNALGALGICVSARVPVLLWGDPGEGKTAAVESAALQG
jgi:hypothetical protein